MPFRLFTVYFAADDYDEKTDVHARRAFRTAVCDRLTVGSSMTGRIDLVSEEVGEQVGDWNVWSALAWVVAVSGFWVVVGIYVSRVCVDEYVAKADDSFYKHRADAQQQLEADVDPRVLRRLNHRP